MVYGVILASGIGKRMGADIPKQYLKLNGKPVIIYTIESMIEVDKIDYIYIAVSDVYVEYMHSIVNEYFSSNMIKKIKIIVGGVERIDTISNAIKNISEANDINDNDVVLFHDAVRPFVTKKILEDSIEGAIKYKATVVGLPVVDTMLYSPNGKKVECIPDRSYIFHGQTPDSFKIKYFIRLMENLTDEQKKMIMGTSQICTYNNKPIYIVDGDPLNFKITTEEDFMRAKMVVERRREDM
ncbi:MAG: IspD/TarI family cytidylyltransferase [Anaerovoracaceae bacterium]